MSSVNDDHRGDGSSVAIMSIVAGVGLLTCGDIFAKIVTEDMTPFNYVLLRSAFAFIPVLIALHVTRTWQQLRTQRLGGQIARGAAMATAYTCYLQSIQTLPIADAIAIIFSSPFLVALFARWFLGEHVPLIRWIAIFLGFAGTLIIVQPGTDAFQPAALWGVTGAAAAAVTSLLARRLGSTEPPPVTSFYTTIAFLLTGVIPVTLIPGHWGPVSDIHFLMIVSAGLIAGTAHFLIILAYRRAQASLVAPFEYASVPIAVVMGYLVFGDIPTTAVWVGMAMIIVAGTLLARKR
ncbi:MAG: hypothetical protein CMM46_17585 [Rhodospirillaceae bacterium]|nr:hypothetical protein [Rhodospirillaceae bacterium]|tara:strand:+ start:1943 stop:2821 length:879 start_codon:yes stop_codon:yes gene_type:complete